MGKTDVQYDLGGIARNDPDMGIVWPGIKSLLTPSHLIDLHLHLDGAVNVDIAKSLAKLAGRELPSDEELKAMLLVPSDCRSLNDFLKCFDLPLSLMQTKETLCEAVRLVCENIKSQGVVYAEIRFAPQLHMREGMSQRDAVEAALAGLKKSTLYANLILCCMRGEGNDELNYETLRLAGEYKSDEGGVVAVDLAGAEGLYPTSRYEELFSRAREMEVTFTIHAGEAAGAESVRDALRFGAKRIGHGVRIDGDEALIEEIKAGGIVLEMCPTSNRMTGAVSDMKDYPLKRFLDRGLKVTVNTDDMGIEDIKLSDEFEFLEREFGLTKEDKIRLLLNALEGAFLSEANRKKVLFFLVKNSD